MGPRTFGADEVTPDAHAKLERYFRVHVREHFAFEEQKVFPGLLELAPTPETRTLIDELRRDHVRILADCSCLFIDALIPLVERHREALSMHLR